MADVFLTLAHGPQGVNKLAVVKRLRDPGDAAMTEMFLDEARLAARLNHPNIVHTYEVGEAGGEYFIAMEYLEGQPLNQVLKKLEERVEGLSEPLVAFIAIQALKGLHHAHEFCDFDGTPLGVVHRDVSPHNLFLTYGGEIKLLDFGIAKATMNNTHTEDGVLKGKVRYMSPEQATGGGFDRRVDIYAFGVVLWEMLARRSLFTGAPLSILTRIVNEEIPPVRGVRPDVSPSLEAIALKAVRRDRSERYASADAMRLDLEAYVRSRSDVASERDLARFMNDMFATIRDEVRAQVRAYASTITTRGNIPSAPGITGTGSLPILPGWSSPATRSSRPPPEPQDSLRNDDSSETVARAAAPRSRWPLALVAILLVTLSAGGAGLFVVRTNVPRSTEAPAVGAAVPPSTLPASSPSSLSVASARVHLKTTPPGARVESNGVIFGPTPTDFPVNSGSQTLRVSLDGYEPALITVDLKPGEDVSRFVTLRAASGAASAAAGGTTGGSALSGSSSGAPASATTHHVHDHDHEAHGSHPATIPAPPAPTPSAPPAPTVSAPQRPNIRMLDESDSK